MKNGIFILSKRFKETTNSKDYEILKNKIVDELHRVASANLQRKINENNLELNDDELESLNNRLHDGVNKHIKKIGIENIVRNTAKEHAMVYGYGNSIFKNFIKNKQNSEQFKEEEARRLEEGQINPESEAIKNELKEAILKSINLLGPRERAIIKMHYGLEGSEPKSLKEIGEDFNLSGQAVWQIELKALKKT